MRTTLNLDDELIAAALEATGETEKTRVIHLGLQALVRRKAVERLAGLGGALPSAKTPRRNRQASERGE
jgi:Arc/MetJ family transcription regulator